MTSRLAMPPECLQLSLTMRGIGITLNVLRALLILASGVSTTVALSYELDSQEYAASAMVSALFAVTCAVLAVALSPRSWRLDTPSQPQLPPQPQVVGPPASAQPPQFPPPGGQPGAPYGSGF